MKYSDVFYKKSSRILLGTAYFGDGIDEKDAFAIMDKYAELGGTHLDTARLYADGRSEEIVGRWVKSRKTYNIQVSTKGAFPHKDAPDVPRLSEKEIRDDLDKSLKATGFDVIDFYWLHQDDEDRDAGEVVEVMNSLIKEGKIRDYGFSNWTIQRVNKAIEYAKAHRLKRIGASQMRFNPAVMNEEGKLARLVGMDKESFEFYKKNKIPVAAYSSQAKGFFSKMSEHGIDALSEKARLRYVNNENLKTLEVLKKIAREHSCSIAAVICGAFCSFSEPEVFPLIGGSRLTQIEDSMSGGDVTLTKEELSEIFRFIL
jgi:aryl-alcohol dehydrogenase-like predicted oxidoreductase